MRTRARREPVTQRTRSSGRWLARRRHRPARTSTVSGSSSVRSSARSRRCRSSCPATTRWWRSCRSTCSRGPRELRAALERTAGLLRRKHGIALRAGVSPAFAGLAAVGRAYGEAERALRHAGPGAPAIALEEVPLFDYLAAAADETAHRLIPPGARALLTADRRVAGALSSTLRAYAECDLNVARAAERLAVHPNTVHYRLRRVQELSGRDPRRFAELLELRTALRLLDRAAPEAGG